MEQRNKALEENEGSDDEFFDACEDVNERKWILLTFSLYQAQNARLSAMCMFSFFFFYIYQMRIWRSKNMTGTQTIRIFASLTVTFFYYSPAITCP